MPDPNDAYHRDAPAAIVGGSDDGARNTGAPATSHHDPTRHIARRSPMRFPTLLTLALSCAALGVTAADAPPAPGANPPGPHGEKMEDNKLHRALKALDDAIEDLKKAPHDFGGHKAAAIEACENARKQLHEALAFDEKHEKGGKGEKEGDKGKGEKGKGEKGE
jgi:hypothetical protein